MKANSVPFLISFVFSSLAAPQLFPAWATPSCSRGRRQFYWAHIFEHSVICLCKAGVKSSVIKQISLVVYHKCGLPNMLWLLWSSFMFYKSPFKWFVLILLEYISSYYCALLLLRPEIHSWQCVSLYLLPYLSTPPCNEVGCNSGTDRSFRSLQILDFHFQPPDKLSSRCLHHRYFSPMLR